MNVFLGDTIAQKMKVRKFSLKIFFEHNEKRSFNPYLDFKEISKGECGSSEDTKDCRIPCPSIYRPVCGFNGETHRTFSSECEIKQVNCKENEGKNETFESKIIFLNK